MAVAIEEQDAILHTMREALKENAQEILELTAATAYDYRALAQLKEYDAYLQSKIDDAIKLRGQLIDERNRRLFLREGPKDGHIH